MENSLPSVYLLFVGNSSSVACSEPDTLKQLDNIIRPHIEDLPGLLQNWREKSAMRVYAVCESDTNEPIGLIAWTGPLKRADPSWWIHDVSVESTLGAQPSSSLHGK